MPRWQRNILFVWLTNNIKSKMPGWRLWLEISMLTQSVRSLIRLETWAAWQHRLAWAWPGESRAGYQGTTVSQSDQPTCIVIKITGKIWQTWSHETYLLWNTSEGYNICSNIWIKRKIDKNCIFLNLSLQFLQSGYWSIVWRGGQNI